MTTELILSPSYREYYASVDGILIKNPKDEQVRKSLLLVTPQPHPVSGHFDFEHFVWTTEGQAYRAYAEVSLDSLWELTFGNTPTYAENPHEFLLGHIYRWEELIFVGGPLETSEESGRDCIRAWALSFASDYVHNGELKVLAGDIQPIMFRQKKFDYTCRLYANRFGPYGLTDKIFPVFEHFCAMEWRGGFFDFKGPIIANEYLPRFLKGKLGYYERCKRKAPSSDFQVMRLVDKTN